MGFVSHAKWCAVSNMRPKLPEALPGFEHVNRYWDPRMKIAVAKILPGECYVSKSGEMISTVLGSCISACIRDVNLGIGGMNHFMLPIRSEHSSTQRSSVVNAALCYGNWAMEFLINTILALGAQRADLEVKVFGGGRVLSCMTNIDIGSRNIDFVKAYLEQEKMPITSSDVGGERPRKILYFPDTGAVKLKRIVSSNNGTIEKREQAYINSMRKIPRADDIEIFDE